MSFDSNVSENNTNARIVSFKNHHDLRITIANNQSCYSIRPQTAHTGYAGRQHIRSGPRQRPSTVFQNRPQYFPRNYHGHNGFNFTRNWIHVDQRPYHSPRSDTNAINRFAHRKRVATSFGPKPEDGDARASFLANPPPSAMRASRGLYDGRPDRSVRHLSNVTTKPVGAAPHSDHMNAYQLTVPDADIVDDNLTYSNHKRDPHEPHWAHNHRRGSQFRKFTFCRQPMRCVRHRPRGGVPHYWRHDRRDNNGYGQLVTRTSAPSSNTIAYSNMKKHTNNMYQSDADCWDIGMNQRQQPTGDEYIDDFNLEDLAKYKLQINMDNFIVDSPTLSDPILTVPLSEWHLSDLGTGDCTSQKNDSPSASQNTQRSQDKETQLDSVCAPDGFEIQQRIESLHDQLASAQNAALCEVPIVPNEVTTTDIYESSVRDLSVQLSHITTDDIRSHEQHQPMQRVRSFITVTVDTEESCVDECDTIHRICQGRSALTHRCQSAPPPVKYLICDNGWTEVEAESIAHPRT